MNSNAKAWHGVGDMLPPEVRTAAEQSLDAFAMLNLEIVSTTSFRPVSLMSS